uniref:hypothetical protein n=1 Tax=Roseivirga sp. TaxID=1964215 RepID=UPI004047A77A
MFSLFKKPIKGWIEYCDIKGFYLRLSKQEREKLLIASNMGMGNGNLIQDSIEYVSMSCAFYLTSLIGNLSFDKDLVLIEKLFRLLEEEVPMDYLDKHFYLSSKIQVYYKLRSNPAYFQKAIEACYSQILISQHAKKGFVDKYGESWVCGHTGFQQLSIVKEKQKAYDEALELCIRANNEGWYGDWPKRIERLKRKVNTK